MAMKRMRGDRELSASPPASSASATPVGFHGPNGESRIDDHSSENIETDALATSPAAAALIARQRPACEKLAIGPLMVFGEMITGECVSLQL